MRGSMGAMPSDLDQAYAAALDTLLRGSHLMAPDEMPGLALAGVRELGAESVVLWLVDYELATLVPMVPRSAVLPQAVSVDGSLVGRAFRTVEPVETDAEGGRRLLLPMLDGV